MLDERRRGSPRVADHFARLAFAALSRAREHPRRGARGMQPTPADDFPRERVRLGRPLDHAVHRQRRGAWNAGGVRELDVANDGRFERELKRAPEALDVVERGRQRCAERQREPTRREQLARKVARFDLDLPRSAFALALAAAQREVIREAQELAQDAIVAAWANKDGWDPDKEPLLKHLAKRVIGLASNEYKRKRNAFEVKMTYEALSALPAATGAPAPDEELDRRRYAALFNERLSARLASDEFATMLVTLMTEGVATPRDQASATGRAIADIREARRRVFYNAGEVSKELAKELDLEDDDAVVAGAPDATDAADVETEEEASP